MEGEKERRSYEEEKEGRERSAGGELKEGREIIVCVFSSTCTCI